MKKTGNLLWRLPVINLYRKSFRSVAFIILSAILSFVLFGGCILTSSINNGIDNLNARMGADLIVVPLGYDAGMESILLKGEPGYFYFEKEYMNLLKDVEGIENISAQFYLTSTSSDCCDMPIQIIGFDPESDFTILPWIREVSDDDISDGDLVIGNSVDADENVTFFNKEYNVAAKLDETGTGLDQAVYANMNTLMDIFENAKKEGYSFIESTDPENYISSIMIRTSEGYSLDDVVHNIHDQTTSVKIIRTDGITSKVTDSLNEFVKLLYVIGIFLFLVVFTTLAVVFSVTVNERKKELAVLRSIGTSRSKITLLLMNEFFLISTIGGVIGVALSSLAIFPFSSYIGQQVGIPYLLPGFGEILILLVVVLVISILVGPLAGTLAVRKINRNDTWLIMKEGV